MKLISISAKNFSPKRLFSSKKDRSKLSRSEPPSFGSGSSSSSDEPAVHKPESTTPTSVLPGRSGDWTDTNFELVQAFKLIDNDAIISIKELEEIMSRVGSDCGPVCDSELRETFEIFDADHDGKITAEELFSVFANLGDDRCTLADCRRMIAGVDKNGDGFVCFEDFARMMEQQR